MDIVERLRIKSNMIFLGERIAFGSECELMDEAAREIEALRAQLAECQWISVDDRLPENDDALLFVDADGDVLYGNFVFEKVNFYEENYEKTFWMNNGDYDGGSCPIKNVTHWMPLPQPPKAMSERG